MDESPTIFPHVQCMNMGITLRDLWATIYMVMRTKGNRCDTPEKCIEIAEECYLIADAMVAVRTQEN